MANTEQSQTMTVPGEPHTESTAPVETPTAKHWYTEPVTAALVAGAVGLVGTAVNAFFSIQLERQKQEGLMILEAIKTGDQQAAARNLLFLSQAALVKLSDVQAAALASAAGNSTLPVLPRPGAPIPANVEFKPSPSLTTTRETLLANALSSFEGYARGIGLPVTAEKIKITIATGADASSAGAPGWLSRYNDADKTIVTASDFADDPSVVLREYTWHSLWDAVRQKQFVKRSARFATIGSGLAAYFPCSFSNRREIGSKAAAMAGGNHKSLFDMADPRPVEDIKLDNEVSIQMDGGSIWGSLFWEIRELLGKEVSDRLLVMAWSNVAEPANEQKTYEVFFKSVLDADQSIEAGKHSDEIKKIFGQRGVR